MSEFGEELPIEPRGLNKDHDLEIVVADDTVIVLDRHNLAGFISTLEEYLGDMRRAAKR